MANKIRSIRFASSVIGNVASGVNRFDDFFVLPQKNKAQYGEIRIRLCRQKGRMALHRVAQYAQTLQLVDPAQPPHAEESPGLCRGIVGFTINPM